MYTRLEGLGGTHPYGIQEPDMAPNEPMVPYEASGLAFAAATSGSLDDSWQGISAARPLFDNGTHPEISLFRAEVVARVCRLIPKYSDGCLHQIAAFLLYADIKLEEIFDAMGDRDLVTRLSQCIYESYLPDSNQILKPSDIAPCLRKEGARVNGQEIYSSDQVSFMISRVREDLQEALKRPLAETPIAPLRQPQIVPPHVPTIRIDGQTQPRFFFHSQKKIRELNSAIRKQLREIRGDMPILIVRNGNDHPVTLKDFFGQNIIGEDRNLIVFEVSTSLSKRKLLRGLRTIYWATHDTLSPTQFMRALKLFLGMLSSKEITSQQVTMTFHGCSS